MLADASAELQAVESFLEAALDDRNAHGTGSHPLAPPWPKRQSTRAYERAVDWGVQVHGGYEYMLENPIASAYATARFLRLLPGARPGAPGL